MPQPKVRMTHPDLPEQPIWVRPQAVPVHLASGWQESPEPPRPPKPPKPPLAAAPAAAGGPSDKPAGRRRPIEPITSSTEE